MLFFRFMGLAFFCTVFLAPNNDVKAHEATSAEFEKCMDDSPWDFTNTENETVSNILTTLNARFCFQLYPFETGVVILMAGISPIDDGVSIVQYDWLNHGPLSANDCTSVINSDQIKLETVSYMSENNIGYVNLMCLPVLKDIETGSPDKDRHGYVSCDFVLSRACNVLGWLRGSILIER